MKNTNLKKQLVKLEADIFLYEIAVALPCQRFLSAGRTCGKDTNYAIVVERLDYHLIIPICSKHLPQWAKTALKEGGQKDGGSNAEEIERASKTRFKSTVPDIHLGRTRSRKKFNRSRSE